MILRKWGIRYNRTMGFVKILVLLAFVSAPVWADVPACPVETSTDTRDSLLRYRDFFERKREQEAQSAEIQRGAAEVRAEREAQKREQARALEEQLKNRKKQEEDLGKEQEWLAEKRAEQEEMEMARRRYVQSRDCLRKLERTAHGIPDNTEYDLDTD